MVDEIGLSSVGPGEKEDLDDGVVNICEVRVGKK